MLEDPTYFWSLLSETFVKLGVAAICGFLLGIERERKDKPAGLRTIILITVGSALFMIVSTIIALVTDGPESITRVDPSRIAAQVVSGVGFLGGGAIIQARGSVHGLTTAAVIWTAAGIGLCIGVGFPLVGLGATLIVLVVLVVLDPISSWLSKEAEDDVLELEVPNDSLTLERIQHVLYSYGIRRSELESVQHDDGEKLILKISYSAESSATPRLLDGLAQLEGVRGTPVPGEEVRRGKS